MGNNGLTGLSVKNFTAFSELELEFCPGVNVFIGANSTGKTHLLRLMYSAFDVDQWTFTWQQKLAEVFLPYKGEIGRLVRRGKSAAELELRTIHLKTGVSISRDQEHPMISRPAESPWYDRRVNCVYIPAKEMLANAPGFLSLHAQREIHFEGVYVDILLRAYAPPLRENSLPEDFRVLLADIERMIEGTVVSKGEEFFISKGTWELEFTLLAEGYRKLGLLWQLIRNGTIAKDSILFLDEPEANLNPGMMRGVVAILLKLQRMGVQVFLATNDYVVLRELDLQKEDSDQVRYFSLYKDKSSGEIACGTADDLDAVDPNLILDTFVNLYDRDVERALKIGKGS